MTKRAVTKGGGAKPRPRRAASQSEAEFGSSTIDLEAEGISAVEDIPFEVAIVEANSASQQRAQALLAELGYRVAPENEPHTLRARLRGRPPQAILVGLPEQEALAVEVGALTTPDRPVVIASMPSPALTARTRATAAGADLFAIRPHTRDHLAAALAAAERVTAMGERLKSQRAGEDLIRDRLKRIGESDLATGFFHIEFFERVLVVELKRSRRYGYPLAAALVGLDAFLGAERPTVTVAQRLRRLAAEAIVKIVRDIDLPVDLAEDRMLVFLPYTDIEGAEIVGNRIAASVAECPALRDGERTWRPSVSIGIAALPGGKPVSFARLVRDAHAALKEAQADGGGRVVVRS